VRKAVWWREVNKLVLLYLSAFLVGWLLNDYLYPILTVSLVLAVYWLFQLRRVAGWIGHPQLDPPEASGIWGELFDSIYHLQRRNREQRDRLQSAVSYLRDSLAALKDGAVLIDSSGNIEWCNAAAGELLGLQYPRDKGQALLNLVRLPTFHQYMSAREFDAPFIMQPNPTSGQLLQTEVTPFGKGNSLIFFRDVTREEKLKEMRRDFVANVSHELRTPLTVITGYLLTLLEPGLVEDEKLGKPLRQMRLQAERMESLLHDLLWLSRLESIKPGSEELSEVDIGELLYEVCEEARTLQQGREISVDAAPGLKLPGNYQYLHSAVLNLVSNALKYSDGPVRLEAGSTAGSLFIAVEDKGPGIDEVHLPRLTERFYRVEQSRSQDTGGTGLGLAIVKHVLAVHRGDLEIESKRSEGSTFRCVFPL
jgi:two-component system phosphate regulon sensor histidine kinase PhoR